MIFNFDDLIERKLVQKKSYPNGLSIYKYTRRVFYDALWNEDARLLEARGIVLDEVGNVVVWPFTKVFNHHENGTELPSETQVVVARKVNGFMAAARYYKGELIVSTTGTLDSDYAQLARSHLEKLDQERLKELAGAFTLMFEICDASDPHIVAEEEGAYLIGARIMQENYALATEFFLDQAASVLGASRPATFTCTFVELLEITPRTLHEGFMVRLRGSEKIVMKIKSTHYLTKKFIMRMGGRKVDFMYDSPAAVKQTIAEEFYSIVDYITQHIDRADWREMSEVWRRRFIEDYFMGEIE